MKTQNFGRALGTFPMRSLYPPCPALALLALKNYRENRENGNEQDEPKLAFPSFGLEDIISWEEFDKAFVYEEDERRGREEVTGPKGERAERYWYIIKHTQSGTIMEGFSRELDFEDGYDWYLYKFTDTHCPAIRQWMEEKDLNYLRRIKHEKPALFQKEFAELGTKNPDHPAVSKFTIVWDLWKLPAHNEYDNYLQWPPQEVLEDVLKFLK